MNTATSYIFPSLLAVVLHALVVAGLMHRWESGKDLDVTRIEPYYIDAMVVTQNPYKIKEQRAADAAAIEQARRQRVIDEQAAQARQARIARDEEEKARQAELERVMQEEAEKLAGVDRDQPEAIVPRDDLPEISEEERLRMEQSLAMAVLDEQEYRRAVTDDEKAMAYVAQIKREIEQNWSRPPSARTGMQTLLKVSLVPTGEVIDVSIVESSGNEAFDRSAILAVEKADRFVVPSDSRQFERNFREFEVLFRPEDLRL